jgi:sugar phosphate isomerase/epimerase
MAIRIGVINNVIREEGPNALRVAKELGFDGVEFFVPAPWESDKWLSRSFQEDIRATAGSVGIEVPSLALAYLNQYPLASPDPAVQWATRQSLLAYIDVARALGTKQLLLAFYGAGELAYVRQRGVLVEQLKAAAPAAERAGVLLGVESTLTSRQYLDLIQRVGSPAVNIYLDLSNPYFWLHDTAEQIRALGSHLGQVHFKEGSEKGPGGVDLGEGYNRWDEITAALKAIRYDGWGILETSSNHGDVRKDAQMNLGRARDIASRCTGS